MPRVRVEKFAIQSMSKLKVLDEIKTIYWLLQKPSHCNRDDSKDQPVELNPDALIKTISDNCGIKRSFIWIEIAIYLWGIGKTVDSWRYS